MTSTTTRLTGYAAIDHADVNGCTLSKYADPTEGARDGLTVDVARDIADEDPSLIYVDVDDGLDDDSPLVYCTTIDDVRRHVAELFGSYEPSDAELSAAVESARQHWDPATGTLSLPADWDLVEAAIRDTAEVEYHELFRLTAEAMAFETHALSIGRDLLPPFALVVIDGGEPTAAYWRWLAAQVEP